MEETSPVVRDCEWCREPIKHQKWSWYPFCSSACVAEDANYFPGFDGSTVCESDLCECDDDIC